MILMKEHHNGGYIAVGHRISPVTSLFEMLAGDSISCEFIKILAKFVNTEFQPLIRLSQECVRRISFFAHSARSRRFVTCTLIVGTAYKTAQVKLLFGEPKNK